MKPISQLVESVPQKGRVDSLFVRQSVRGPIHKVDVVEISAESGIIGDHFNGGHAAKRQVTLIQFEHIAVVEAILGKTVSPELLRRNIVVAGINLLALKQLKFKIGSAVFQVTGNCPPCSRMEENLGVGGYAAMRGHGGITASVVKSGTVKTGDIVSVSPYDK